jgi:ssDNA-binding Zn-finger/Zn-ribbon topoisomerase 1
MVIRLAKKGRNAGGQFWGCSGFPHCRETESLSDELNNVYPPKDLQSSLTVEHAMPKANNTRARRVVGTKTLVTLTSEELEFLKLYEIPLSRTFNASGMPKTKYALIMGDLDLWVAYGVTPCKERGHKLRTRAGHCVMCSPKNVIYLSRHDLDSFVYVAYSKSTGFSKVGIAQDPGVRLKSLKSHKYGAIDDWEILFSEHTKKAGHIEFLIGRELNEYHLIRPYVTGGEQHDCRELFQCSAEIAISATKRILAGGST